MRKCDKCGKPGVVDGACEDHVVKCKDCGCDIHYSEGVCEACNDRYNDLISASCMSKCNKEVVTLKTYMCEKCTFPFNLAAKYKTIICPKCGHTEAVA